MKWERIFSTIQCAVSEILKLDEKSFFKANWGFTDNENEKKFKCVRYLLRIPQKTKLTRSLLKMMEKM